MQTIKKYLWKLKEYFIKHPKVWIGIVIFLMLLATISTILPNGPSEDDIASSSNKDQFQEDVWQNQTDNVNQNNAYLQELEDFLMSNSKHIMFSKNRNIIDTKNNSIWILRWSCSFSMLNKDEQIEMIRDFLSNYQDEEKINEIIENEGERYNLVKKRMESDCNKTDFSMREKWIVYLNVDNPLQFEDILPWSLLKYFEEYITISNLKKAWNKSEIEELPEAKQQQLIEKYKVELWKIREIFNYRVNIENFSKPSFWERFYWDQDVEFERKEYVSLLDLFEEILTVDNQVLSEEDINNFENFKKVYNYYSVF